MPGISRTFSLLTLAASLHCYSQAPAPATVSLEPYTAPDKSATAGVPAGWQVTSGAETIITMSGPGGAAAVLGETVIARNAAFQAGQRRANGVDITMPYSASLAQKFGLVLEQEAAAAGKPFSQFAIESSTPLQLAPALGECARFVAGFSGDQGAMKMRAIFCSLPLDATGTYKNMMLMGQAPATASAQLAPTMKSIFKSYRVPADWLERKLAPFGAAPSPVATSASATLGRGTAFSAAGADVSANCFDLSVLRQTPARELPRSCGGTKPD